MVSKVKKIGILTSGGDAPGMNAAVRAVTRTALFNKITVMGVYKGYVGLMTGNLKPLVARDVSRKLEIGGTLLYSARSEEFKKPEGVARARQMCITHGIDGLVVVGGDGSFRGARDLSLLGLPCIGIPATIDNDISSSDYSIGFDTAVNTVVDNVDRLRDTCQSHDRCSVVEVMGRNCGDIALNSAICCGAVSALIPEIDVDIDRDVIAKMKTTLRSGKSHFIVIVAEGLTNPNAKKYMGMSAEQLAKHIEEKAGIETRATVIGHVQRGGRPTNRDRVIASQMGHYAVELLRNGIGNRVVVMRDSKIVDLDILEALEMKKTVNMELVRVANEISI